MEIINFEKFNPRTDRKKHSWFRLENDFINDEKLFRLDPLEKFVWIALLALRSKKLDQVFELDVEYLADQLKVKKTVISSTIQKLEQSKIISIHQSVTSGNQSVSTGSPTNVTYERTNEQKKAAAEIPDELKKQWIKTYGDEKWIDFEIAAAEAWMLSNPTKAPKSDFKRFFNGWLKRGWESHRKTLSSKSKMTYPPPPELSPPPTGPMKPEIKSLLDKALGRIEIK